MTNNLDSQGSDVRSAPVRELERVFDALPAAVYTTDAGGKVRLVNRAALELAGHPGHFDQYCISHRLYTADGDRLPHDQCPMAIALHERRPIRGSEVVVERPDGTRVPVLPFPTPLFDEDGEFEGAVNVLVDISRLKAAEDALARRAEEQEALYTFTDSLYRARTAEEMYQAAQRAILSALRCDRAAVLLFDGLGIARFVASDGLSEHYRAAVEGHSPWLPGERKPEPIFVPDIGSSDQPEDIKGVVEAEGIRGIAFIPLVSDGGAIGKFMAYYDAAHPFGDGERDLALTIARQLGFGIQRSRLEEERSRAEAHREMLVAELNHRVKNTLATVLSIARQTFKGAGDEVNSACRTFTSRIQALAKAHDDLAQANWNGVSLEIIVKNALSPYSSAGSTLSVAGPRLVLCPRISLMFGLAIHELATNAAKYGALSRPEGRVHVSWCIDEDNFLFNWAEVGGPPVVEPSRKGFGRLLLERVLSADVDGKALLTFAPAGLRFDVITPLTHVTGQGDPDIK